MINIPDVSIALVAVSRDCFVKDLSLSRRNRVFEECQKLELPVIEIEQIIENENDVKKALTEINGTNATALVVYLGNFGPEGPETLLAQKFNGPVMFVAAAEESGASLYDGRGDAYCGMLNASYNIGLRNIPAYIPEYPVGEADEIALKIKNFVAISRIITGVKKLKIISFGPRPHDFLACNAPIKPLFDMGIEIMENSELDLFEAYNNHADDKRIPAVIEDMKKELGKGNKMPGILPKLAQYELTLLDWMETHKGMSDYVIFANKCWPAFQTQFGFVPCFVNSRFASRGIPIACETDIYGALTEYILTLATMSPVTLLDINNTVPYDMYDQYIKGINDYKKTDVFMGFHCGNTPSCCMKAPELKYQRIMKRLLEPVGDPDISRGTLEGTIMASDITLFRLQSSADTTLRSYIAEGEVLDVDPQSFGSIGVIAIKEMKRFYRHVLIEKRYPHHAGLGFKHTGHVIFEALKLLGVKDIAFNQPSHMMYKTENPFK